MTLLEENGIAKKNIPKRRFYMVYNLLNYNGNNAKIKKGAFAPLIIIRHNSYNLHQLH